MDTKEISIGGKGQTKILKIGGNNPISVQTMWKDSICDVYQNSKKLDSIVRQIHELQMIGCDIIRFAVPDMESAKSLSIIASNTT